MRKVEIDSVIRDAWATYDETGDPADAVQARAIEVQARALAALLYKPSKSKFKLKRKKWKRMKRINPDASILAQVRGLAW